MKYKLKHPTERVLIFIVIAIVALVAAILWVYGQKLDILWDKQQSTANTQTLTPDFRQVIQSAQRSLYSPGVVDADAQRVYFPSLSVYVPLTDKSQTLMYSPAVGQTNPTEATFSARSIVNSYLNQFDEVTCIAKPAGISVDKTSDAWKEADSAGTVQLADGRTLYLYKHTSTGCKSIYALISPDDIIDSLKQAKSY